MSGRRWTSREVLTLAWCWGHCAAWATYAARLPGRSYAALRAKATQLGLHPIRGEVTLHAAARALGYSAKFLRRVLAWADARVARRPTTTPRPRRTASRVRWVDATAARDAATRWERTRARYWTLAGVQAWLRDSHRLRVKAHLAAAGVRSVRFRACFPKSSTGGTQRTRLYLARKVQAAFPDPAAPSL